MIFLYKLEAKLQHTFTCSLTQAVVAFNRKSYCDLFWKFTTRSVQEKKRNSTTKTSNRVSMDGVFILGKCSKTLALPHIAESFLICEEMEKDVQRCENKPRLPNEYSTHSSLTLRWAYPWPVCKAAWIIISTYRSSPSLCPDQTAPGLAQLLPAWDQQELFTTV